jgi:hypothetical protein
MSERLKKANERAAVLREAEALINGDRADQYGDAADTYGAVALIWQALTGRAYTAREVLLMLAGMKLARQRLYVHRDSAVDLAGYAALAQEVGAQAPAGWPGAAEFHGGRR